MVCSKCNKDGRGILLRSLRSKRYSKQPGDARQILMFIKGKMRDDCHKQECT